MERENFNGRVVPVKRRFGTLRSFVGWNEIHPCGDILCISLRNNDKYDLFLMADGVSKFIDLLRKYRNGEIMPAGQSSSVSREMVTEIIKDVLKDGVGTEEIKDGSVQTEDLADDVREKITNTYDPETEGIRLGGLTGGGSAGYDVSGEDGSGDI